ncbi:MAG: C1 family peptidase [Leptolyngbyaceae bacterium]|nr:C1 family peptidase [Leptolyngbyaceae bacterium]
MNLQSRIGGYNPGKRPDDAKLHEIGRFQDKELPPKVDLRKYMTDVEAQVGNSCVANAFVGAYEYLAKRDLGESGDVSRLFVYYNARAIGNKAGEDCGTQMNYAIKALIEHGACSEEYWPNDEELILQEPETAAYEHAANFKITEAEFIKTDLNLWRHTLAEGYPIAFALNTFQSFDDATKNKGRVAMPKQSDNVRETHGWHAMLCVGYSDKDKMFIVRNSWGTAWGDKGYCYIPYDYVMHQDYNGDDSWIIKSVSDLDFSAEVWEDDESFFDSDGSLLLYDFYVRTEEPDGFIEALTELCESHVESEEDYYFDYDYEESEDEGTTVSVMNFDLTIEESESFLEELDALCLEYAVDEDYDFNTDGESGEDEDEEDEEDEEEYDEDEEDDEDEEEYEEDEEDEEDEEEYEDEEE